MPRLRTRVALLAAVALAMVAITASTVGLEAERAMTAAQDGPAYSVGGPAVSIARLAEERREPAVSLRLLRTQPLLLGLAAVAAVVLLAGFALALGVDRRRWMVRWASPALGRAPPLRVVI